MRKILKDWHAKEQNDNDCNKAILSINIMRSWNTTENWETPNIWVRPFLISCPWE